MFGNMQSNEKRNTVMSCDDQKLCFVYYTDIHMNNK